MQKKTRWIPLPSKIIEKLSDKITKGGYLNIFIFRVTPFTRGYTSVISGLIHIKPKIFFPILILSGVCWASLWVIAGHLLGPSWDQFVKETGSFRTVMLIVLGIALLVAVIVYYIRGQLSKPRM